MQMLTYIRAPYFVAAFAVGMLYVYLWTPTPRVVVRFPSPHDVQPHVYKTETGSCFMYEAEKVPCPADASRVRPQPVAVEDFVPKNRAFANILEPPFKS